MYPDNSATGAGTRTRGAAPSRALTGPEGPESLGSQLQRVNEFYEAEEYAAADGAMRAVLADPAFPALADDQKAALYGLAGGLASAVNDQGRAWAMFDQALALPGVDPDIVFSILDVALQSRQPLRASTGGV